MKITQVKAEEYFTWNNYKYKKRILCNTKLMTGFETTLHNRYFVKKIAKRF